MMSEPRDQDESTKVGGQINIEPLNEGVTISQHQPKSVANKHHQKQNSWSEELRDSDGSKSCSDEDSVKEPPHWEVIAKKREQAKHEALASLLNIFKVDESPRRTPDTTPSLCSSCAIINFDKVFFDANIWTSIQSQSEALKLHAITGVPVHIIPRLHPDMMNFPCPLCRLLAVIVYGSGTGSLKVENDSPSWQLRALLHPDTQQVTLYVTDQWENIHEGFGRSGVKWYESMRRGRLVPCCPDIRDPIVSQTHQLWKGHAHEDQVDYLRVIQMLKDCEASHDQACTESLLDHPSRARVIDCNNRVVVPLTADMKYIALSYVWGPHPQLQPQSLLSPMKWSLPEHLPQTIEDSIAVVKGLGLQYLWVDRYCIQQVHATDKQFQISQMAKIYGAAYATICALGDHDDYGLHGVSLPRKSNSFLAHNKYRVAKVADPQRIKTHIQESIWHKRGWTFQEIFLSRRALFFTSEEIFVVCKEMCTSESLIISPYDEYGKEVRIEPDRLFWAASTYAKRAEILPIFEQQVQEYQTRSLKFNTDMLAAFEGLLSVQDLITIMGVPIMKLPPERCDDGNLTRYGFAYGLAWYNIATQSLKHNPECNRKQCDELGCFDNYIAHFPSWAWVSRSRIRTRFDYFTRPSRPKFKPRIGAPHGAIMDVQYCAEISIQTDTQTQSVHEFLAPLIRNHQDKAITGGFRHLHIKSVLAHWRDTGDQAELQLQSRGSSRWFRSRMPYWLDYGGGQGGWLRTENRPFYGSLRLDYNDPSKKRDKGLAILLFATAMSQQAQSHRVNVQGSHHKRLARTIWLVVRDIGDGTWRREGLIESHGYMRPSAARKVSQDNLVVPPNLEKIVLG
jgi:hypothetical protein